MTDPTTRETLVNRLFRIPTKVTTAVFVVAILVGLVVGGPVGWVLLGASVIAFTAMLALMWPDLSTVERMLRLAVLVFLVAVSVVRLVPAT